MTTAQFLTLIFILSHIDADHSGVQGWGRTVVFLLIFGVNLLLYLFYKFMFPDKR